MNAGFATLNRLLSKQRDRVITILAELRADAIRRNAATTVKGNVEQVLRLVVGAIDFISHGHDPPSPDEHLP
ncbi:hypothetical protein D3C81_2238220 [compost metagenome]